MAMKWKPKTVFLLSCCEGFNPRSTSFFTHVCSSQWIWLWAKCVCFFLSELREFNLSLEKEWFMGLQFERMNRKTLKSIDLSLMNQNCKIILCFKISAGSERFQSSKIFKKKITGRRATMLLKMQTNILRRILTCHDWLLVISEFNHDPCGGDTSHYHLPFGLCRFLKEK